MYCNRETLKLALDKGFTYCTCNGGYPDCICESKGYGNVRLDDVQRWLRDKLLVVLVEWDTVTFGYNLFNPFTVNGTTSIVYDMWEYDTALEQGIIEALNLI